MTHLLKKVGTVGKGLSILWILPVIEGLYHFNKPWPELLSVFVFSLGLSWWTLKRSSALLPLIAHFIIEVELILFQLYIFN